MQIRPYQPSDRTQLNALALEAFAQFKSEYSDWSAIQLAVSTMADLAEVTDIFVVEESGQIIGGIVYMPPLGDSELSQSHFDPSWAVMRMLVVSPAYRGRGIGKQLTAKFVEHAKANGVKTIALHTSPIMEVALAMYLKMGFQKVKEINPIYGVEYAIYSLDL